MASARKQTPGELIEYQNLSETSTRMRAPGVTLTGDGCGVKIGEAICDRASQVESTFHHLAGSTSLNHETKDVVRTRCVVVLAA